MHQGQQTIPPFEFGFTSPERDVRLDSFFINITKTLPILTKKEYYMVYY